MNKCMYFSNTLGPTHETDNHVMPLLEHDVGRAAHPRAAQKQIRNTAQRFRFQMVLQRYNTLQTHWQRVCREIERGTYKRHVVRAEQRFARRSTPPPPPPDAMFDLEFPTGMSLAGIAASLEVLDSDLAAEFAPPPPRPLSPSAASPARALYPAPPTLTTGPPGPPPPPVARSTLQPASSARPAVPAPRPSVSGPALRPTAQPSALSRVPRPLPNSPTSANPGPPANAPSVLGRPSQSLVPGTPNDLSDQRLRELYTQLVDSRRKQRESTANVTFDSMARTLRDSAAKLREQHGRSIDFEVVVKDGRTVLRPVVK